MRKEFAIGFLIVALALSVGFVSANGNGNQTPTPVDGSPVGTVTQPTPIWPTATASPEETAIPEEGFVDDGVVVKDLPTTGSGSTAGGFAQLAQCCYDYGATWTWIGTVRYYDYRGNCTLIYREALIDNWTGRWLQTRARNIGYCSWF